MALMAKKSKKARATESVRSYVLPVAIIAILWLAISMYLRSWDPFLKISGGMIIGAILLGNYSTLYKILNNKKPWDDFTPLHISIATISFIFVVAGLISIIERAVWFYSDQIPSALVAEAYGNKYSVNSHRLFKLECDFRARHSPMIIRQIGNQAYVRCGDWYPQVYTISVASEAFALAVSETAKDLRGTPAVVERN
jgi:hypothetical protein